MMNSNLGMAIVCMVNSTEYMDSSNSGNSTWETNELWGESDNRTAAHREAPKLNWSAKQQGYIFSAFNLGLLTMLGTGLLADKFNAKYMIVGSVALAAAANVLIALGSPLRYSFSNF